MGPSETKETLAPGREIIPVGDKETLAPGREIAPDAAAGRGTGDGGLLIRQLR